MTHLRGTTSKPSIREICSPCFLLLIINLLHSSHAGFDSSPYKAPHPLWSAWNGFLPYLLPLLGPLLSLLLLLSIGPCVFRWVSSFINNKLENVRHQFRAAAYAALQHRDPDAYAMLARMTYDRVLTTD